MVHKVKKIIAMPIKYEMLFQPTKFTAVSVGLTQKELTTLSKKYGAYGFDWYFVDENRIKFFKDDKWSYAKYSPSKVMRAGEK